MAKKRVSELDGCELDYWVAMAMGESFRIEEGGGIFVLDDEDIDPATMLVAEYEYKPSSEWHFSGPIIEDHGITLICSGDGNWSAMSQNGMPTMMTASTPLIAAMRTFVAMRFGQFVDRESILH